MEFKEISFKYMKTDLQFKPTLRDFHKRESPLGIIKLYHGIILPVKPDPSVKWGLGGVVDKNGFFIKESIHPGYDKEAENRFGGMYEYTKVVNIDEDVIYCDPIILQWGHFLVDSISRLWYALESDCKIAYCGYGFPKDGLEGPYLRLFELLGIEKSRLIDVRFPTGFKSVTIPEMSYIADLYYTDDYKRLFLLAAQNIVSRNYKEKYADVSKVYFTRCRFTGNGVRLREIGEKEIEHIFRNNGYKIVAPESCSLDEQIYILSHCRKFVSLSGTIAYNILFSSGIEEFVILNKTSHMQRQQYYLNEISGIETVNVDVYKEPFIKFGIPKDTGYGPFALGVTDEFINFADSKDIRLWGSKLYYLCMWVLKYGWLAVILPLRKIIFFVFKFRRGIIKIKSHWRVNEKRNRKSEKESRGC